MSVKLELYRVFKEVAEAGNITAAAQALYISQSAVSPSIKQLEGELQTRLFARKLPWRGPDTGRPDAALRTSAAPSACWRPARRSCPRAGSCRWDT